MFAWKHISIRKLEPLGHIVTSGLSVNGEDQGKTSATKSYEAMFIRDPMKETLLEG